VLLRHYVYFAVYSAVVPPDDMTRWIGIDPDDAKVRGSKRANPPRPVSHSWRVGCREAGLSVNEQIDRIIARLHPVAAQIGSLAEHLEQIDPHHGGSRLQIVRFYNDSDGEDTDTLRQLLGWHLDRPILDFLQLTRADLDVDEYSYDDGPTAHESQ
jgi:hypothetical protein